MNAVKFLGGASLALVLAAGAVFAQEVTLSTEVVVSQDAGGGGIENPGVDQLVTKVTALATGLDGVINGDLAAALAASRDSREKGIEAIDTMLEAARNVQDSLDADSEIWVELNSLLTTWAERRDAAIARSAEDPRFADAAELWQESIDNATKLRTQILDQAATSRVLVDRIEADREIVLEFYDIGAAGQAIKVLQQVSDQLGEMNAKMQDIVDQTGAVAGATVSQN